MRYAKTILTSTLLTNLLDSKDKLKSDSKLTRDPEKGTCESCGLDFEFYLVHNGFNNSAYSYCNACGKTAILDVLFYQYDQLGIGSGRIAKNKVQYIANCECGGKFQFESKPRCPHCLEEISAEAASKYINRKSDDPRGEWNWQQDWSGIYCILIEQNVVRNNWKD